jgi:hypothetical protein
MWLQTVNLLAGDNIRASKQYINTLIALFKGFHYGLPEKIRCYFGEEYAEL